MNKLKEIIETAKSIKDNSLEEQVKVHFVCPLLEWLGFPNEHLHYEYPVWTYTDQSGTKHADIAVFSSAKSDRYVEKTPENQKWISDHCLLVIETKRPKKLNGAHEQAKFYCDNLGAIAYLCTDSKRITGYIHKDGIADKPVIDCNVSELLEKVNELLFFRYDNLSKIKTDLLTNNDIVAFDIRDFYPDGPSFPIPENYISRNIRKPTDDKESNGNEALSSALQHDKKILLLDNAGTGKTYELLHLAQQIFSEGKMVPIYYSLRNYTGQDIESIEKDITKIAKYPYTVLLLDGYDEIESQYYLTFPKKINDYTLKNQNRIIITSRSNFIKLAADSKSTTFNGFSEYVLLPLSEKDIQNYITVNGIEYPEFQKSIQENNLNDLEHIPFFLSRLCNLFKKEHTLPGRSYIMIQLLQESMDYDEEKYNITLEDYDEVRDEILSYLSELGLAMQCMQLHQLENQTYKSIFPKDVRNKMKYSSLWKKEKNIWSFEHNHFQEFLAAFCLKEQDLDTILKITTYPFDNQKIRTSWVNTVSHLLPLMKDLELLNWIIDNDPETLLFAEQNVFSDEVAETVFYRLFINYCQDQFIFPSNGSEVNGLKGLIRTPGQFDYLCNVLKEHGSDIAKINTLKLLNVLTDFGTHKQRLREATLHILKTSYDTSTFINAVKTLSNHALFCSDDICVIKELADNAEKQLAVLSYIAKAKLYDVEAAYVARLLSEKFPEELSISLSLSIDDIAKNISTPEALITIVRAIPTDYDKRILSNTRLSEIILEKAANLSSDDDSQLLPEIFEFYYRSIIGYSNNYFKPVQTYLSATANTITCYKYMAEHHPDIFDYRYLLIDINNIDSFIEEYINNTLPKEEYFVEYAKHQPNNAEYFDRLEKAIYQKTGEHVIGVTVADYTSLNISVYQEIFDSLFDKESFQTLVRRFLSNLHVDESITFEQLSDMDVSIANYNSRYGIIYNYLCDVSNSKSSILSLPDEPDWESISVQLMVNILKTKENISISEKQELHLSNFVYECLKNINWKKEIVYKKNGCQYTRKAYIIPYLSSRLFLELTEDQYIGLLYLPKELFFQDSMEGSLPKYVMQNLSPEIIMQGIERNIAKGIAKWSLAANYISYCKDVKSDIAFSLAFEILSDDEYEYYYKWIALSYLIALGQSENVIDEFSDTENTNLLKVMASLFSGIWTSNQPKLVQRLEIENQKTPGSLLFLSELLAMNSRYGLDVYTKYVRKNNAVPEAKEKDANDITENISKISEISLIDLIQELFVLSYADGFKDCEYIGLRYTVTKVLENYADQNYEIVFKLLNTIKDQYSGNKDLCSQCSNIIYSIKIKHYRKEDQPLSIKETKSILNKLCN